MKSVTEDPWSYLVLIEIDNLINRAELARRYGRPNAADALEWCATVIRSAVEDTTDVAIARLRLAEIAKHPERVVRGADLEARLAEWAATGEPIATPQAVVEFCAKEIEWMMRGAAAHDCMVLQRAYSRLRFERDKIILRAGGSKV